MILPNGILDITQGIIAHQVNCQNKFGAGLAKAIAQKYPKAKQDYHALMKVTQNPKSMFGKILYTHLTEQLMVAHIFSQYDYGNAAKTGKIYTDYEKLIAALKHLTLQYPHEDIYIPKGIGCGLAGGDWEYLSAQIKDLRLTVVSLPDS